MMTQTDTSESISPALSCSWISEALGGSSSLSASPAATPFGQTTLHVAGRGQVARFPPIFKWITLLLRSAMAFFVRRGCSGEWVGSLGLRLGRLLLFFHVPLGKEKGRTGVSGKRSTVTS